MTTDPQNSTPHPEDDKSWLSKAKEMFGIEVNSSKKVEADLLFEQIAPLNLPVDASEEEVDEPTAIPETPAEGKKEREWSDAFIDGDDFGGALFGEEEAEEPIRNEPKRQIPLEANDSNEEVLNNLVNEQADEQEEDFGFGFDETERNLTKAIHDIEDAEREGNDVEKSEAVPQDLPEDSYWDALDDFHWKDVDSKEETQLAEVDEVVFEDVKEPKEEKRHKKKKEKSSKDGHKKKKKKKNKKEKEIAYLGKGEAETTEELRGEYDDDDFGLGLMDITEDNQNEFEAEELTRTTRSQFSQKRDHDEVDFGLDIEEEESLVESEFGFGIDDEEEEKEKPVKRKRRRRRKPRSQKREKEVIEEDEEAEETLVNEEKDDDEQEEERPRKRSRRRRRKKTKVENDDSFGCSLLEEQEEFDDENDDENDEECGDDKTAKPRSRKRRTKQTRKVSEEYLDLPTWEEAISYLLPSSTKSGSGKSNPTRKPRPKKSTGSKEPSDSPQSSKGKRKTRRRRPSK